VHAELPQPIGAAAVRLAAADPFAYSTYLASRPPESEERAVAAVIAASLASGCRTHVLHLSAASCLETLTDADGHVTAETCPHYLSFEAEQIRDGATEYKCAPPIRDAENRERLWEALRAGALSTVVSDHSPCTPELKKGSFFEAWGGIASLQLGLRAVWTEARRRAFGLEDVCRWMSEGPARIAGLERKGAIAEGKDADIVVFEPDEASEVDPSELHHRNPVTPYASRRLDGRVAATYVRGVDVYSEGRFPNEQAGGLLTRGAT
jgi:allantoinase